MRSMRRKVGVAVIGTAVLLALAICAVVLPTGAAAAGAGGWTWVFQNPIPLGRQMNATAAGTSTAVWSVGDYGTILFWNGSALTAQRSNTTNDLYGVAAVDASNAWAVGEAGTILRTTNGGATWTRVNPSPTSYDLLSVTAAATNRVWAAGGYDGFNNAVIVYFDGSTWSNQLELPAGGFTDIYALNANQVWAVSGWTWYTSNGGANWTMINDGSAGAPYQISAVATNNVYAIDWDGTILRSTSNPGGTTWTTVAAAQDWPAALCALDATHIYFVGWDGTIRMYNGTSWTSHTSGTTNDIYDVDATATNRVFATGTDRFLTNTGTTTWTSRTGGTTAVLYNFASTSADELWAVGAGGVVQHSTNGGNLWEAQTSGTANNLQGAYAVDASHVWAVGNGGTIRFYNGTAWGGQTSGTTRTLYSVWGADATHVWAVGATGTIRFFNGSTWGGQASGTTSAIRAVFGLDSSHVWAVADGGTILFFNGTSWAPQTSGTTANLLAVWAADSTHVWAVGQNGTIRFFNGTSWSVQASPTTRNLQSVSAADPSHVWACGGNGVIIYFDGNSWADQASSMTSNALYRVFAYDTSNIWAVGAAGTILFADPPYVKACAPAFGDPSQTLDVEVIGGYTHWQTATPTLDFGSGVSVVPGSVNVIDNTHTLAQVEIDAGAELGPRDVSVTTVLEAAIPLAGGFVVGSNPTIALAEPASAPRGWTGDVRITGSQTHFSAASAATFGSGIQVNSVVCEDVEHVRANITVSAGAQIGARAVNVTTGGEVPAQLDGGFVVPAPPRVTSVSPSSGPPGTSVTVTGTGFGTPSSLGGKPVSRLAFGGADAAWTSWSDTRVTCTIPQDTGTGPVTVTNTNGTSNADTVFTATSPRWYLAEGSTAWGFDTDIAIINPNDEEVVVRITYLTNSGPVSRPDIRMAPLSRTTVNPASEDKLAAMDFSTQVECLGGKSIAVDRTMMWTEQGAQAGEGHSSIGVESPATKWYLPEGSSAWGFECWLLLMNPSATDAECAVTYMIEGQGPKTVLKQVKARSRASFNIADDIGEADASIMVDSAVPVIPERAMYRNGRREGHDSIGVTAPSSDFYLAEGSTSWGFETYVLVQNPNAQAAEVSFTYMTPSGEARQPSFTVPAGSRETVRVSDFAKGTDVSTRVHGSIPIVAERAMYWDSGKGEACHDSVGIAAPQGAFYFADGRSGSGTENDYETWTLVQNPNETAVRISVTYLTYDGKENRAFNDTIPAGSRRTYNMADHVTDAYAGIVVRSLDNGRNIIAERAMYWNGRAAGTCTIGD